MTAEAEVEASGGREETRRLTMPPPSTALVRVPRGDAASEWRQRIAPVVLGSLGRTRETSGSGHLRRGGDGQGDQRPSTVGYRAELRRCHAEGQKGPRRSLGVSVQETFANVVVGVRAAIVDTLGVDPRQDARGCERRRRAPGKVMSRHRTLPPRSRRAR
jgi:hypothetical protein